MATDRDAAVIAGVLSTAPLCGPCIARHAGLTPTRLDEVFLRIVVTVPALVSRLGCCSSCRTTTTAHCLT